MKLNPLSVATQNTYKAIILGAEYDVCGYSQDGLLILGNGERFEITPMGVEPKTFRSYTLRAVSRLAFSGGKWLVDDAPLETYFACQFASPRTSESDTKFFTAPTLRRVLTKDRPEFLNDEYPPLAELERKATAVAWVEERFEDFPEQTRDPNRKPLRAEFEGEMIDMVPDDSPAAKAFEPIFLSSFYRVQDPAKIGAESSGPAHVVASVEGGVQEEFAHDVFLSHSAKDKARVRPLAERVRRDGLLAACRGEIDLSSTKPSSLQGQPPVSPHAKASLVQVTHSGSGDIVMGDKTVGRQSVRFTPEFPGPGATIRGGTPPPRPVPGGGGRQVSGPTKAHSESGVP